jgi:hypothetical protein
MISNSDVSIFICSRARRHSCISPRRYDAPFNVIVLGFVGRNFFREAKQERRDPSELCQQQPGGGWRLLNVRDGRK